MNYHNNIDALTYQRTSAEYYALCHQTYAFAEHVLVQNCNASNAAKKAVIMDIDETILDNSTHNMEMTRDGRIFNTKNWDSWCNRGQSALVPGALGFIKKAGELGVQIFFVTSRADITRPATIGNLEKFNIPVSHSPSIPETNLFMAGMLDADQKPLFANKYEQGAYIRKTYEVILSVGDNLSDYAADFSSGKKPNERATAARTRVAEFGVNFILIPNPVYGGFLETFGRAGVRDEDFSLASYDIADVKTETAVRPLVRSGESPRFDIVVVQSPQES